jgi:hypothetical protein
MQRPCQAKIGKNHNLSLTQSMLIITILVAFKVSGTQQIQKGVNKNPGVYEEAPQPRVWAAIDAANESAQSAPGSKARARSQGASRSMDQFINPNHPSI